MNANEETELQEIANRVNLGAHQHVITAEDMEGRSGRWVVHRPTMRDEIKIGVEYSRSKTPENTANPVDIDPQWDNLAFFVATLNHVIDLRPDWFPKDAAESFDAGLLEELFLKYCEWRDSFRRRVSEAPGEDSAPPQST